MERVHLIRIFIDSLKFQSQKASIIMAARRISQETFNDVVRENIEEFEMDKDDAIKEAIAQFRKQGIDLSNIDLTGGEGRQQLVDAITTVQETPLNVTDTAKVDALIAAISEIAIVCDKSHICSRRNLLIMEEEGGFNALQWHLDPCEHHHVLCKVLKTLADLSFQQEYTRDLFEPGGSMKIVSLFTALLSGTVDGEGSISEDKVDVLNQSLVLCKVASRSEMNKSKRAPFFSMFFLFLFIYSLSCLSN